MKCTKNRKGQRDKKGKGKKGKNSKTDKRDQKWKGRQKKRKWVMREINKQNMISW